MAAAEASRRSPDSADLVVICTLNGERRGAGSLTRASRAVIARDGVGLGGAAPARRGPARAGAEWGALVGWRPMGSRAAGGARPVSRVCVTGSKVAPKADGAGWLREMARAPKVDGATNGG